MSLFTALTSDPGTMIFLIIVAGFSDIITMQCVSPYMYRRSKVEDYWQFYLFCLFGTAHEAPGVVRLFFFFLQFRYLISVRCFTIIAIGHLYNSGDFKKVNDCFTGLTTNWTGKVYIDTCKRFHKKKLSKKLNHVHFFLRWRCPAC